jgi:transcriptional regulator of NAD metabolism
MSRAKLCIPTPAMPLEEEAWVKLRRHASETVEKESENTTDEVIQAQEQEAMATAKTAGAIALVLYLCECSTFDRLSSMAD